MRVQGQGTRRQRYMEGAQSHSGVDEAVLAALSDADRAAVLAAMSGPEQAEAPTDAPAESSAQGAEELPKFDCQGSTDQLQVHVHLRCTGPRIALLLYSLFSPRQKYS